MMRLSSSTTSTSAMTDDDCGSSLADDVLLPNEENSSDSSSMTPMKHYLVPVCTIGKFIKIIRSLCFLLELFFNDFDSTDKDKR